SGLTATGASSSQINLSWTDNASNEDGFQIERSLDGVSFSPLTNVGANITIYSDTGLKAATAYSYRVRAYNSGGNSAYSNTSSATTAAALLAAPSALKAVRASSSSINLSWTDNANNET